MDVDQLRRVGRQWPCFLKEFGNCFGRSDTREYLGVSVKGQMGIAFTTAQRAIDPLRTAKIITDASETKRNRVFCAKEILKILEEPARLTPG